MTRRTAQPAVPRALAVALIAAFIGNPGAALAHASASAGSLAWTLDPWVTIPLALSLAAFLAGRARLRAHATAAVSKQTALYLAGWLALAAALVSPLHEAGSNSFAAHMLEHELLMLIAAPLLVAAHPGGILMWSLPHALRRRIAGMLQTSAVSAGWRALTQPLAATALQILALWLWHAPRLFDLALAHSGWHVVQHLSFFGTALLFWSAMFARRHARRSPMLIVVCLFATAVVSGALGALMAFSASPWYAGYRALTPDGFGLTPVQDQQIAGVLMWIPGGLVHVGVALALLARVLREQPALGAAHAD